MSSVASTLSCLSLLPTHSTSIFVTTFKVIEWLQQEGCLDLSFKQSSLIECRECFDRSSCSSKSLHVMVDLKLTVDFLSSSIHDAGPFIQSTGEHANHTFKHHHAAVASISCQPHSFLVSCLRLLNCLLRCFVLNLLLVLVGLFIVVNLE